MHTHTHTHDSWVFRTHGCETESLRLCMLYLCQYHIFNLQSLAVALDCAFIFMDCDYANVLI